MALVMKRGGTTPYFSKGLKIHSSLISIGSKHCTILMSININKFVSSEKVHLVDKPGQSNVDVEDHSLGGHCMTGRGDGE